MGSMMLLEHNERLIDLLVPDPLDSTIAMLARKLLRPEPAVCWGDSVLKLALPK
jgi:hypothetical protein